MARENLFAAEFPDDLATIQKLRSEDTTFAEICEDFELLTRELTLICGDKSPQTQGVCLDLAESLYALRQELAEILSRQRNSTTGGS